MPYTLANDQVYALTAYLLNINKVIDRVVTISKMRGRPHRLADGTVFVTIHPSFLLRI
jgi:hypothetical protein